MQDTHIYNDDATWQDQADLKTVLLKQCRPIDVEQRLAMFKARHAEDHADDAPSTNSSTVRGRRIAVIGSLLAVAASLLAVFILRYQAVNSEETLLPKRLAMTTAARHARHATISSGSDTTQAFASTSTHLAIPREAYMLKQADAKPRLLSVPYGCSADITLPDGSIAYVHAGSELSFSPHYINGKRVVIIDGEAYFKVKHDAEHPFVVQAGDVSTTVYGTEFNVNTHGTHGITVTLVSGCVGVTSPSYSHRMAPGDQVECGRDGVTSRKVDLLPYTNWRDGYLYYDRVPLSEIVADIAHNYNLEARFENRDAMTAITHFVCERGAEVQTVVAMLNQMGKAKVRLEGKTLVVSE